MQTTARQSRVTHWDLQPTASNLSGNRSVRIAHDVTIQGLLPPTGVQRAQRGLLRALDELAPNHEFVLVSQGTIPIDAELPKTWRRHVIPSRRPGPIWREIHLMRFLVRRGFDLVHSPVSAIPLGGPVPRLATVHEVPWLTGAPRLDRGRRLNHRLALRHAVRHAAGIVTPSRTTAAAIEKRHPGARAPIHVVPHGVDAVFFKPSERPRDALLAEWGLADGPYVLSVGAERPRKNHTLIARALDDSRLGEVRWLAAGAAADSRRAGHERRHGLGPVSDPILRDLYAHATALVFPSFSEGFGLPALEAMAAGCPAIVSNRGALPEVVGDAAQTLEPRDTKALADAVFDLLTRPESLSSRRARGREHARSFTWQRAANAMLDVYRQIAAAS